MTDGTDTTTRGPGDAEAPAAAAPRAGGAAAFSPVHLQDVELGAPLPPIHARDGRYAEALVLVRLHGRPLGQVRLPLTGGSADPESYAPRIWEALRDEIADHLAGDDLPVPDGLTASGLAGDAEGDESPRCRQEREAFRKRAPSVSVVICTHEGAERLRRTLPRVLAQDHPRFEVLVVDNAPDTPAVADLINVDFGSESRVRYAVERRAGLANARNAGLRNVRYDLVAFLDDDESPDEGWLLELTRGFYAAPDVAAVSGPILPAAIETPAQAWFEQFGGHSKGRGFRRAIFDVASHERQSPLFPAPPFGAGGNMAFHRDVLWDVGGFDPAFGAGTPVRGSEDTAAFYDLMRAGLTVVWEPAAFVRHEHHRDARALREQLYGYGRGLSAFYARAVARDPLVLRELVPMVPKAARYLFDDGSARVSDRRPDFPRDASRAQFRGMLTGPFVYLASRWPRLPDRRSG